MHVHATGFLNHVFQKGKICWIRQVKLYNRGDKSLGNGVVDPKRISQTKLSN